MFSDLVGYLGLEAYFWVGEESVSDLRMLNRDIVIFELDILS